MNNEDFHEIEFKCVAHLAFLPGNAAWLNYFHPENDTSACEKSTKEALPTENIHEKRIQLASH